jgi:hypothetical protein
VSVITVAAPRVPDLIDDMLALEKDSDLQDLRGKIRLVYRMAARNGKTSIILGRLELQIRFFISLIRYEQAQWDAGHMCAPHGLLLER